MSEQQNPYRAGTALAVEAQSTKELASGNRRFWTFWIDWLATRMLVMAIGFAYALVFGVEALKNISTPVDILLGVALYISYYVVSESLFGRTVGKALLGTRVVTLDGRRPTFGAIVVRTLSRLIPLEPLSFTLAENWWHDSLSGTKVVRSGAPANNSSKPTPLRGAA